MLIKTLEKCNVLKLSKIRTQNSTRVLAINLKQFILIKLTEGCILVVETASRDSLLLVEHF